MMANVFDFTDPAGTLPIPDVQIPVLHTPEGRLMQAILEEALRDVQNGSLTRNRRAARLTREAWGWICSADEQWLYSFGHICAVFDIEPERIRAHLRVHWEKLVAEEEECFVTRKRARYAERILATLRNGPSGYPPLRSAAGAADDTVRAVIAQMIAAGHIVHYCQHRRHYYALSSHSLAQAAA